MQATDPSRGDLLTLRRAADGSSNVSAITAPRFSWTSRVLVPGGILLALALLIAYAAQDMLIPARQVRVVPVVLRATTGEEPAGTVQAAGWVEADPYSIAVSALADGVVREVLALEGQTVKAGDVVARLIDDDAKLALARADAELAEKQARLDAAQRAWDNPTDRTRAVATTSAMVAETKGSLAKLNAEIASETATMASLKLEADRLEGARSTNASSEFETARARYAFEAQRAVVEAKHAERPIFEAQLAQRSADLLAAQEHLRLRIDESRTLAEATAQLALSKAARDEAALRLSRMEVRSPADGIVLQRLTLPGAKLVMNMDDPHSAHAVLLYDPRKLQVRVDVPLADAAKVGVGQKAQIVVGVLPDRTFDGVVTRIVNEADIQKNTLQVKVAISDPSPQLKPEMLARVRFVIGGSSTSRPSGAVQAVFAPLSLVARDGDSATAWVVDPGKGVAEKRMLELGQSQVGGWIAVRSGLFPGDKLIADSGGLREGQGVKVIGEAVVEGTAVQGASHVTHRM